MPKPMVLLVDDDEKVRHFVGIALHKLGYEVYAAESGAEAVRAYRQDPKAFAAVLLDVSMPGLIGPETLAELKRCNPEVRSCFVTGNANPAGLGGLGARCVLTKPFRAKELSAALHGLLGP